MFFLSVESHKNDQVKVTLDQSENVDANSLCEILFTASSTLQKTHPHLLKALLFCILEVLLDDRELLKELEEVLHKTDMKEDQ